MQEPTRLFDLLAWRKELHPERPVFKFKENGEWKEHYIDEYIEKVDLISYALMHLGRRARISALSPPAVRNGTTWTSACSRQVPCCCLSIRQSARKTTSISSTTHRYACWWSKHRLYTRKSAISERSCRIWKISAPLSPWRV